MGERKRRREAITTGKDFNHSVKPGAFRRKTGPFRMTWRGVAFFMGVMVLLDIFFYAVFRFGFDHCYALLCLLE